MTIHLAASCYHATTIFIYFEGLAYCGIMPRRRAMPERELAICHRLLAFRLTTKLSRMAVARELEINSSTLNNYERGVAPLPYAVAAKVCAAFDVSQAWLADGTGGAGGYIVISPEIAAQIPPALWFSIAFDRFIKPTLSAEPQSALLELVRANQPAFKAAGIEVKPVRTIGVGTSAVCRATLAGMFKSVMEALPAHLVWPYYSHLLAASNQFQSDHADESAKSQLTPASTSATLPSVKSQLESLLVTLNRLAKAPGKKTELADFLGAPLASVSRWLSGKRDPGGETTLRLLEWVQAEEAKQTKSPAPGSTGTRRRTRMKEKNQ
jgi:transcriptional regulator with XRE-family HTH domain